MVPCGGHSEALSCGNYFGLIIGGNINHILWWLVFTGVQGKSLIEPSGLGMVLGARVTPTNWPHTYNHPLKLNPQTENPRYNDHN